MWPKDDTNCVIRQCWKLAEYHKCKRPSQSQETKIQLISHVFFWLKIWGYRFTAASEASHTSYYQPLKHRECIFALLGYTETKREGGSDSSREFVAHVVQVQFPDPQQRPTGKSLMASAAHL